MFRALALAFLILPLTACLEESQPRAQDNRTQQARAAQTAAQSVQFNANAEIDNIKRRLELTANPNLLGYIILLNDAGQPILYEGVRGKVTTSGSRLTPPDRVVENSIGGTNGGRSFTSVRAPSDTGTYDTGTTQFIYYWSTSGTYRQWSGQYLYSDQPIRLRVEPLVVNVQDGH